MCGGGRGGERREHGFGRRNRGGRGNRLGFGPGWGLASGRMTSSVNIRLVTENSRRGEDEINDDIIKEDETLGSE